MGVPVFYKWLVGKYPEIVEDAIEKKDCVDSSQPNPNGKEFDNLYLDMNGIIHPCFHPEDQLNGPTNFDDVFRLIFEYIDVLFNIVRPRQLLYMAIDGVAPRAKMNQQRTRRFRTAKDAEMAEEEEARLRKEFERNGKEVLPKEESELYDSNIITPGTEFMHKLAIALESYIRDRINNNPGWKSTLVILSDSNVPGEGEHKIMSFIRQQRSSPGYNPETRHCLYGLDADLIMLALATREINFYILREDVLKNGHDNALSGICAKFSKTGIESVRSRKLYPEVSDINRKKPYQFVNIWTLREYLKLDMGTSDAKFESELERIVDDFIFICLFTGNDFLPRMPALEIHEGALDLLIHVYKKMFSANGYLIDSSRINEKRAAYMNIKRVEKFILEIGTYGEKIFRKRYDLKQAYIKRFLSRIEKEEGEDNQADDDEAVDLYCNNQNKDLSVSCGSTSNSEKEKTSDVIANTNHLKQKLKSVIRSNSDLYNNGKFDNDKVKLGCNGWKTRYYKEKFSAHNQNEIESVRKEIVEKYTEGLCWTLQYYFSGVCSWSWYYPFYYGPFASDMKSLSCPSSAFKIDQPFKPYNQLMAVLPPRSSNALPKAYMNLMKSEDSPLLEFYPKDFDVDSDGKRFAWQGVCKLPFIDEEKLLAATKNAEKDLEIDEVVRNSVGKDRVFVRKSHGLGLKIASVQTILHDIDTNSCGLNGYISMSSKSSSAMSNVGLEDSTVSAYFINPDPQMHIPRLIVTNVSQLPKVIITRDDIVERMLWHEHSKPYHPFVIYTPRNMDPPKEPVLNELGMHLGSGSGWGGRGRGRGRGENDNEVSSSAYLQNQNRWGEGRGRGRGRNDNEAPSSAYLQNQNRWGDNEPGSRSSNWRPDSRGRGRYGRLSTNERYRNSAYLNNRYRSESSSENRW